MTNQIISKVGIHSVGGNRTGYGAFLQRINEAGRRLSVIKCRDDFGAVDEPLQYWPDVLTIGAKTDWDDADYNVDAAYNRIVEAARLNPKIKYWEYFNERNGDWDQQADLYIALMPRLVSIGLRLCLWNCASGTPPFPNEDGGVAYAAIDRACHFAKLRGYDMLLGLHEYQSESGTIERHNTLADYLQTKRSLLPIAITEYGFETFPGVSAFMTMIRANDPEYMRDSRVIGCAAWTLGGGGWAGSNYATALPSLGNYIATVEPIAPAPDPVPVPPPSPWRRFGGVIDQRWTDDLSRWVYDHGGVVLIEEVPTVIK